MIFDDLLIFFLYISTVEYFDTYLIPIKDLYTLKQFAVNVDTDHLLHHKILGLKKPIKLVNFILQLHSKKWNPFKLRSFKLLPNRMMNRLHRYTHT